MFTRSYASFYQGLGFSSDFKQTEVPSVRKLVMEEKLIVVVYFKIKHQVFFYNQIGDAKEKAWTKISKICILQYFVLSLFQL